MSARDAKRLAAGLDQDEKAAQAACPGPWTYQTEVGGFGPVGWVRVPLGQHKNAYTGLTRFAPLGTQDAETCAHIARHDPARALRDIAAKRAILALYEEFQTEQDRQLADPACKAVGPGIRTGTEVLGQVVAALASVYTEDRCACLSASHTNPTGANWAAVSRQATSTRDNEDSRQDEGGERRQGKPNGRMSAWLSPASSWRSRAVPGTSSPGP